MPTTQFPAFAFPGSLETRTGGYIYDARVIAELRNTGWQIDTISLPDSFPYPSVEDIEQTINQLTQSSNDHALNKAPVIIDGLAFGAIGRGAAKIYDVRPTIALVHHPLAHETGLSPATQDILHQKECEALRFAHAIIATSQTTANTLINEFNVDPKNIRVAPPGHDQKPLASPFEPNSGQSMRLLAVGSITPRKNFSSLIDALALIKEMDWTLTIAGSLERDSACAQALIDQIAQLGLMNRVYMPGEVSEPQLDQLYQRAHLFISSSLYEGYGMAMMDAVGFGLPIIAAQGGAVGEVLPAQAGLLVEPGDNAQLSDAIALMLDKPEQLSGYAKAAQKARGYLPQWQDTAQCFADVLKQFSKKVDP